jgi:cobalt-zinc-cadmium efflux system protein
MDRDGTGHDRHAPRGLRDPHGDAVHDGSHHANGHGHHGHGHGAALVRSGSRYRGRLLAAFVLSAAFLVVEAGAAFVVNSLALLSDAGHLFTDVLGLGMALAAISLADRFETRRTRQTDTGGTDTGARHTFGLYRLEILAAFVNALLLGGVALWVLVEAVRRIAAPPEVLTGPMALVAAAGLAVNLVAFGLLRQGAQESLNVRGAYLEVVADAVGSVGVLVAAFVVALTGWAWVDPLTGVAIGLWILPRTLRLGLQAVRILLQAAPAHVDLQRLAADLGSIDGVVDVHDLHVWTLTSDMEAASAHLMTADGADAHGVLDEAQHLLAERYGIGHGTFQVEPESHVGCRELTW